MSEKKPITEGYQPSKKGYQPTDTAKPGAGHQPSTGSGGGSGTPPKKP